LTKPERDLKIHRFEISEKNSNLHTDFDQGHDLELEHYKIKAQEKKRLRHVVEIDCTFALS